MKVNNQEIGFSILPELDKVEATIFRLYETQKGEFLQIHLISKSFGGMFRKLNEKDYDEARKWTENQMWCIKISNRLLC